MCLLVRLLLHCNVRRGVGDAPTARLLFSYYTPPWKVSYIVGGNSPMFNSLILKMNSGYNGGEQSA
jgi:hypothetical protein